MYHLENKVGAMEKSTTMIGFAVSEPPLQHTYTPVIKSIQQPSNDRSKQNSTKDINQLHNVINSTAPGVSNPVYPSVSNLKPSISNPATTNGIAELNDMPIKIPSLHHHLATLNFSPTEKLIVVSTLVGLFIAGLMVIIGALLFILFILTTVLAAVPSVVTCDATGLVYPYDAKVYVGAGATIYVTCDAGVQVYGDRYLLCMSNGKWNSTNLPYCDTNCGLLSNPDYGYVTINSYYTGGTATYTCRAGFTLNGNSVRTCERTWSGTAPHCTATIKCTTDRTDVIIVLDESGSISSSDFVKEIEFAKDLGPMFNLDSGNVRVGLMTFSTSTRIHFNLGSVSTVDQFNQQLASVIQFGGGTSTHTAIDVAANSMLSSSYTRSGVDRYIILVTDGQSNYPSSTSVAASNAHAQGIKVFAIGVGSSTDQTEIEAIASEPQFALHEDHFDTLDLVAVEVTKQTCSQWQNNCGPGRYNNLPHLFHLLTFYILFYKLL